MTKKRSLGVVLVILGVLVNNYAYLTDIVGNSNEGLIYVGWHGTLAILAGLASIAAGVIVLLRAASNGSGR